MKIFVVLSLLALTAISAAAQGCESSSEQQPPVPWGQGEGESGSLHPCGEFLRRPCATVAAEPFLRSRVWQPSSCAAVRQQCCLQLRHVEPLHRCQEMCSLVRTTLLHLLQQGAGFHELQTATLAARNLPGICGLSLPSYCTKPCAIAAGGDACC